jgi:uncharacterized SAM-binding protein YcdF (DUF218 family)
MGNIPARVMQAADLYKEGRASKLILVEENMSGIETLRKRGATLISKSEQARNIAIDLGIPEANIILLPGGATSTQMEAVLISEYIKHSLETDTLILVSSPSHTRRAGMIFQKALKKENPNICILTSPSQYNSFTDKHWWKNREDIQTVLSEYTKLMAWLVWEQWKV